MKIYEAVEKLLREQNSKLFLINDDRIVFCGTNEYQNILIIVGMTSEGLFDYKRTYIEDDYPEQHAQVLAELYVKDAEYQYMNSILREKPKSSS